MQWLAKNIVPLVTLAISLLAGVGAYQVQMYRLGLLERAQEAANRDGTRFAQETRWKLDAYQDRTSERISRLEAGFQQQTVTLARMEPQLSLIAEWVAEKKAEEKAERRKQNERDH